ncbi:hypothetical protein GCM10009112_32750 [Marinomonas arenicola]
MYLKDLGVFSCTVLAPNVFQNLIHYLEEGKIQPLVAQTYPLKEIVQAQEAFQKKHHLGKIVLKIIKD